MADAGHWKSAKCTAMINNETMKKSSGIPVKPILIAALCVLVVILIIVLLGKGSGTSSQRVQDGRNYIISMEGKDVDPIEKDITAAVKEKFFNELDEKLSQDPDYVWTALDQINTVMMGDSRTVPFATYGFMDESRVLATGGETIHSITDFFDDLVAVHPNLVVLAFGLNDIDWSYIYPEDFAQAEMEYVDYIQELLPDAYVYIQSIIIPRERVEEVYDLPGLSSKAREWDQVIQQLCRENGYRTIDISELVEKNADYFGEDGAHLYAGFYPLLAEAILRQYLQDSMVFDE